MEACGEVPPGRRVKMPEKRASVSRAPWLALGLVDCRQTLSTPLPNAKRPRQSPPRAEGSEAPHNPVCSSPRLLVPPAVLTHITRYDGRPHVVRGKETGL